MSRTILTLSAALFAALLFSSCENRLDVPINVEAQKSDSLDIDTTSKVPPADFISYIAGINAKNLEDYINPTYGFWFLKAGWFHPYFIRLRDLPILTKQEKLKFEYVKQDTLPKVDCSLPAPYWTKKGCFANKENTFIKDVTLANCELSPEDEASIRTLARTIRWTVINSNEGKYYFSLINGKRYLTFVDMREQCQTN